ncbi:hypothetical protein PRIPAC_83362 [Pristionchus pacificus]|uniref:Uncharacterized protein n=1 Tax=Pristionchus pacificus TaxID=54126 RepID=A0A2A6BSV1_PRIPA|nr:hypothetical protein PRIPAC_83362 [Pristionchus pacificus]|eukprot:PDM68937.1 hypothetical protein PRIPAC_47239 [Pristionchus pacificus]
MHANKTVTEAYALQCSEGGSWIDSLQRQHDSVVFGVTCAMARASNIREFFRNFLERCQTCTLPTDLDSCRGDATCIKGKLTHQQSAIGDCRIAKCNEQGFMIRTRSRFNELITVNASTNATTVPTVIYDGGTELRCNEKGDWSFETFQDFDKTTVNLGRDVEAVCYWPKCKRCVVKEMPCPPGDICSIDWLAEPDRNQECDVASCRNGNEMIFRDSLGILRTVESLRCNDATEWEVDTTPQVLTKEEEVKAAKKTSLFDDDYVDGSEQVKEEKEALTPPTPTALHSTKAVITCRKILPPCQRCVDLRKSDVCPGGAERGCNDIVYTGGAAINTCRVMSCPEFSVLWSYHLMRWNKLDTYLECTDKEEWKLPGGTVIPDHAEVACKYNGECACVGARLGTSSACREDWEDGCDFGALDLFAMAGECSRIECKYKGKLAVFKPNSKEFVRTVEGPLTCVGNGTYQDNLGNKYTSADSSVTCHSWEGTRHCARACTWDPADGDTSAFTEWSVDSGCRNLRCAKDGKMELHDTENDKWIARESISCTQLGFWTSKEDRGAMLFPYKTVNRNFIEVRCTSSS